MLRKAGRLFSGREFYIPKGKVYQYTPTIIPEAEEDGRILVYKNSTMRPKAIYLPKLYFPVMLF